MSNKITDETMEYIGILAKLELDEAEREQAKIDISRMLEYMDSLNELNTDGIEPMSHIFSVTNVFREDEVSSQEDTEHILANAPERKETYFKVPKAVQ